MGAQEKEEEKMEIIGLEEEEEGEETSTELDEETESITPSLKELEEILGYKFNDQRLLQEAYMHHSLYYDPNPILMKKKKKQLQPCISYERLEFVGDSVLNLLVAKELYIGYPQLSPGPLTRLRAANVDNEKLARVAVKHGLYRFLKHKNHHLDEQTREFTESIVDYPMHSNGLIDTPKFLADIVESTIGAIFIDSNFSLDIVWKVFKELLEPIINPETMRTHPVTELLELCQKKGLQVRFVKDDSWKENISIEVFVDNVLLGSATYGYGTLKKEIAQNRAAKTALDNLKQSLLLADHKTN